MPEKLAKSVAVLMGGWSAEREVSLVSGRAVADALRSAGYDVREIDVSRNLGALLTALTPAPDAVFNALHGTGGEDGCVQGVLDFIGLSYTHSGLLSSAVAMDKALTKNLLKAVGVRSPEGRLITAPEADLPPLPYVLKPNAEGSSVGVWIVREGDNRSIADYFAELGSAHEILVEPYIPGRELTTGVMSRPGEPARAMAVTEIVPRTGFYDYEAKYRSGGSDHILPADIPAEIAAECLRLSVLAHETLGCSGISRSDFRWDDSRPGTEGLYFLEINTQPGMTPTSLIPEQAGHIGMSFTDLVRWMVEAAL